MDYPMKISESKKGLRVRLTDAVRVQYIMPIDAQIDLGRTMLNPREAGTLRSGRVLRQRPGYEEGLFVYVKWDEMPTPEAWHIHDLEIANDTP